MRTVERQRFAGKWAREKRAFFIFRAMARIRVEMKAKRGKCHRSGLRGPEKLAAVRVRALELLAAVGRVELAPRSPRVARALDRTAGKD